VRWFSSALIGLTLVGLSGCATTEQKEVKWAFPPMARPLQADAQQEIQILRLSSLLQRKDLSDEVKAKMYFERGNAYDLLGLRNLARIDFNQSLSLNPAQPDVFNLLGVYFTEVSEFDSAYEAFDSALELDPTNAYAVRNQAIALYYGQRPELALEQIKAHYAEDPEDPFRALWLYIIEFEISPEKARKELLDHYQVQNDDSWGWLLVGMMLDEIPEEQVFKVIIENTKDNVLLAQRLTEAYFYDAKRYQLKGDYAQAVSMYKLAISFNVYEYVELRYSFLELERIYNVVKDEYLARLEK
jgi:lipoprotein NlpI